MDCARFLRLVAAPFVLAVLAGCGGGGGNTTLSPADPSVSYGTITGNVSEIVSGGRARSGEAVVVMVDGTDLSAVADEDGSFTIAGVPAGLHTLVASTSSRAVAVVVGVERNRETRVGGLVMRDSGQVSGLVTSAETHEPIRGALVTVIEEVTATSGQMPHPVRSRRTNEHGSYTSPALPAGDYVVTVAADGFESASVYVAVNAGGTTPADVALSPSATEATGGVAGVVSVRSQDGQALPLAGVLVRLAAPGDPALLAPLPDTVGQAGIDAPPPPPTLSSRSGEFRDYYTFTDANGAYQISGLPVGAYEAAALRPGLEPARSLVTITADTTAGLDFTLDLPAPRTCSVEGTVTDSVSGQPIANAAVVGLIDAPPPAPSFGGRSETAPGGALITPNPGQVVMEARTDANGRYTLRVPEAVTAVRARAEGYVAADEPLNAIAGFVVSIDIQLSPAGSGECMLSGRVTMRSSGGESSPIRGASVYAVPDDSAAGPPVVAETNAQGEYRMRLLAGRYSVRAEKLDFASETVSLAITSDTRRDFALERDTAPPPPPPF